MSETALLSLKGQEDSKGIGYVYVLNWENLLLCLRTQNDFAEREVKMNVCM